QGCPEIVPRRSPCPDHASVAISVGRERSVVKRCSAAARHAQIVAGALGSCPLGPPSGLLAVLSPHPPPECAAPGAVFLLPACECSTLAGRKLLGDRLDDIEGAQAQLLFALEQALLSGGISGGIERLGQ